MPRLADEFLSPGPRFPAQDRELRDPSSVSKLFDEVSDEELLRCLFARKLNVERAVELFHNWRSFQEEWQFRFDEIRFEEIERELRDAKLHFWGTRDFGEAAIISFKPCLHFPKQSKREDVFKLIMFFIDWALRSVTTQRNGVVFLLDARGMAWKNFDLEMEKIFLSNLDKLPIRIRAMYLVHPPMIIKAILTLVKPFMKAKLRKRIVFIHDLKRLETFIPVETSLPPSLGGRLHYNYDAWMSEFAAGNLMTPVAWNEREGM